MNNQMKRSLFRVTLMVLLLVLGMSALPASAAVGGRGQDENDIKGVINTYFTLRYEALKSLIPSDFLAVTEATDAEAISWRQTETDRLDIRLTIAKTFEDYVIDYTFSLNYLSIDVQSRKATVTLLESNEITYSSNPADPSRMADLRHVITLSNHQGRWVIQRDEYQDELSEAMASSSRAEIDQNIRNNHDRILQNHRNAGEALSQLTPLTLTRYNYANSAALSYSNTYYNSIGPVPSTVRNTPGWNSSWPTSYKHYAQDCTNFISQAIFQGTSFTQSTDYFNPDYTHYSDWWYYKFSSTVDGSSPWVNVGDFYTYLTGNLYGDIGKGPAGAAVDVCADSMIYGNPIFMTLDGDWSHSVIVATHNTNCNITVNSHTSNYYHTPLSTYSAYDWYAVYIAGYFK